tara:strand:- start:298 stop:615 length:318 start_codon:yes stop_codon:yes gene_type:complete
MTKLQLFKTLILRMARTFVSWLGLKISRFPPLYRLVTRILGWPVFFLVRKLWDRLKVKKDMRVIRKTAYYMPTSICFKALLYKFKFIRWISTLFSVSFHYEDAKG